MEEKRIIAIYARQSVDKKDSVSIETQIEVCKTKATSTAIKVYKDKGYSGKNTERPEFQKLLNDVKSDLIETVIVYKIDRISRNIVDFYNTYDMFSKHNTSIVSYNDPIDTTTPMGRASMGILAVFAQLERENIQIRIKDNYAYRLSSSRGWLSGKAPYGYKNSKKDGKKVLEPIPDEIEVVEWLFKTYAEKTNISLGQLQKELNKKGVKGHQSTKGMSRTTINRILSNPVYVVADEMLYNYYATKKPIFINDREEWDGSACACLVGKNGKSMRADNFENVKIYLTDLKGVVSSRYFIMVQNRLDDNSAVASDNTPKHNLKELSGLLKCGECGSAVKMQSAPTLTCTGRNQKRICTVSFKGLKLADIQVEVAKQVMNHLETMHERNNVKMKRRNKIRNEIAELEEKIEALVETASYNKNAAAVIAGKIDDIAKSIEEKQLELKLDVDSRDLIEIRTDTMSIFDREGKLLINYAELDTEKRQAVLRVLVKKINIFNDGRVTIDWK